MVGNFDMFLNYHQNIDISADFDTNAKNEQVWTDIPYFRPNQGHMEAFLAFKMVKDQNVCKPLP